MWYYRRSDGDSSYLVSLDFPFRGFHGLWICYDSIGWNVLSRSIVPGTEAKWPVVQLELENKQSGRAYVWFSFFDQQGKPLRITEATLTGGARERVASNILQRLSNDEALSEPVTFQCQLMFESGIELTESQRQEFAGILIQAMSQLRDATIPLVSEL